MSEWISVDDSMPEANTFVIVSIACLPLPVVMRWEGPIVNFKRSGKADRIEKITRWLPLPELPGVADQ